MPAEIVTGRFCANYFSLFKVPGSKPGVTYTVCLDGGTCTCLAYQYFRGEEHDRTCKHVTLVFRSVCTWNEQWGEGRENLFQPVPDSRNYPVIPGETCPGCGGPVCPVKIAV